MFRYWLVVVPSSWAKSIYCCYHHTTGPHPVAEAILELQKIWNTKLTDELLEWLIFFTQL